MGCKVCIGANDTEQLNFEKNNEFFKRFFKFLEDSGSNQIKEEEFDSNIQKNYLDYSNEHKLQYPEEFIEKENMYVMTPIKLKNENVFKGKWNEENKMEGPGKYYIKNDNIFIEGWWENGELKFGRIFMPDGNIYEGYVKDSKYNGKGKLKLEKAEYEGLFENGLFKNGKMKWNNGYEYEGDFNGYILHGKGKLTGPEGDIYEGDFDNNKMHGEGKYLYQNGNSYEGDFEYGIKKGKGKYIKNNEYIYDGNWDNDVPFGYGKLSNWDNSCIFKCTFRSGKIAEEPIFENGSKDNFNLDDFEIKPEEKKLNIKELEYLDLTLMESEATHFKLGSVPSFLADDNNEIDI